jgi:uncharacterized protein YjbJ (UPF0337 family)
VAVPPREFATTEGFNSLEAIQVNWEQARGQWMQLKASVRKQWGKLTDDDLDLIAGERERLAGKIVERYGVTKEEAERQIASWNPSVPDTSKDYQRKAG